MRNGRSCFIASLFVALLLALASCSGRPQPEHDAGLDGDSNDAASDGDVDGDSNAGGDANSDADLDRDSNIQGPDDVPHCGDGVLDPEEECDDHNRLDGDGCDWLCRLGDGEPPPESDPSFPSYGYGSEPAYVEGMPEGMHSESSRLPLVWTGSELATAFFGQADGEGTREIFFYRYDEYGTMLGTEWEIMRTPGPGGLDLTWSGRCYALFYAQGWEGVFMLRMSPTGKPISDPVLVVEDPCAGAPSVDFSDSGHALGSASS